MNIQSKEQITLIYHNFRGMAQVIRYILCFLNEPFDQILLSHGQKPSSLPIIQRLQITEEVDLPSLIDGPIIISDFFTIIRHLCKKFSRQDLLGETIEQRGIIRQIYYNFMLKKKKEIKSMFKFSEKASQYPLKREEIRQITMKQLHEQSGSSIQLVKLKLKNPTQKYIFGHITVLDFLLFEESFYQINLFGNLEEKNCSVLQTINSIFRTDLYNYKNQNSLYLKVMREFKEGFEKEYCYVQNKDKLESYGVYCPIISNFTKECFKKVWLGPQKYLK